MLHSTLYSCSSWLKIGSVPEMNLSLQYADRFLYKVDCSWEASDGPGGIDPARPGQRTVSEQGLGLEEAKGGLYTRVSSSKR